MLLKKGGGILLLSFLIILISGEESGVVLLNGQTFQDALEQNHHIVIHFSQEDCQYCSEFSEIFTLIGKLHSSLSAFAKLNYSPDTSHLFEKYSIDSTPTVLAFADGEVMAFRYEPSGSGNSVSVQFFKWLQRLFLPLKQWEQDDSHSHQLIVQCHTQEFSQFWTDISRYELWLDVYCGSEDELGGNLVIVHQYGRRVQAWQLENDFQSVSAKLRRLIKAYKYKYLLTWSNAVAQEVFRGNVSAFILITNNQSNSRELRVHYEEIKKHWYENSHSYEPTIFAVSELSLHAFDTLKLKRFLTGHASFNLRDTYHYPIVGFISRGAQDAKYVLNLTSPKNATVLEQFINNVNKHIIKGEAYEQGETQLVQWLNEGSQSPKKESDKEEVVEGEVKVRKILTQQNWNDLLTNYNKPFFVYFTWRHNHKLNVKEKEFSDWWQGDDPLFTPHRKQYSIYLHLLHTIDLPIFPDLTVEYFPSLYFFTKDKEIVKLQGVTDLEKMKNFINSTYASENGIQSRKE